MEVKGKAPRAEYHPGTGVLITPTPFGVTAEIGEQLIVAGLVDKVEPAAVTPAVSAPKASKAASREEKE